MDGGRFSSPGDASQVRVCDRDFAGETLRRLPLADAVFHLLGYALDENFLAACLLRRLCTRISRTLSS